MPRKSKPSPLGSWPIQQAIFEGCIWRWNFLVVQFSQKYEMAFGPKPGERKMRRLMLLGLLFFAVNVVAQTITLTNAGGATTGCLNVLTVDGAAASGSLCFGGFYGEDSYGIDVTFGQTVIEDCTFTSSNTVATGTRTFTNTTNYTCPASANTNGVTYYGTTVELQSKVPRSCGRQTCWALVDTSGTTTLTPAQ
jgi:hypothetical protein